MVRIFSKLDEQAARYASVARWAKPLAHIAAVLEPDEDKTSETVEWEMTQLLEWLKQTYTDEQDSPMVTNVLNCSPKEFCVDDLTANPSLFLRNWRRNGNNLLELVNCTVVVFLASHISWRNGA